LSGSVALKLGVESFNELLMLAFSLAADVFAFKFEFAFELFVLVAGWHAIKTTIHNDAIKKIEIP
jgi:hypothetical protein